MSKATPERIVDVAIDLFNADGVGPVTTNHIAAAIKISPGNLYYHFANKEEIVRAAFERMMREADDVWSTPAPRTKNAKKLDPLAVQRMLTGNLRLYARYPFFARELPSLLAADPLLRERYVSAAEKRVAELEGVIAELVEAKLLKNVGDRGDVRTLVETAWMIGLFCVPYGESTMHGTPRSAKARADRTHAALEKGALLVLNVLRPYMEDLVYTGLVVLVRQELARIDEE